jgi:hypothetical protein
LADDSCSVRKPYWVRVTRVPCISSEVPVVCHSMELLPPLYSEVDEPVGEMTGGDLTFLRGGPSSGPERNGGGEI